MLDDSLRMDGCFGRHDGHGAHSRRHHFFDDNSVKSTESIESLAERVKFLEDERARARSMEMPYVRELVYSHLDSVGHLEPFAFSFENHVPASLVVACLMELEEQGLVARDAA